MFSKLFRTNTSKSSSQQQLSSSTSTTSSTLSSYKLNPSSSNTKLSATSFNNAGLYDRPPIYSVSTISSCFQQQSSNDDILPSLLGLDSPRPSPSASTSPTTMSASSISPSSSTSSSSAASTSPHGGHSSQLSTANRMSFGGFDSSSIKRQLDKKQSITSSLSTSSAGSSSNKFDTNSIKQIYIAPHCIRYTNSTLDDTIYRIDEESLNEIAAEILESDNTPPKLQIVFYNSQYFAINNSHLQVYKQLQMCGLITHVQADVLSVETIPYALRQHLLQTPYELSHHHNGSGSTVNSNDDDDDGDECTDGEEDDTLSLQHRRNVVLEEAYGGNPRSNSCSYPAASAIDILSAENLSMLEKEMLVDETYEFGACENCAESEDDDCEQQPNGGELKTRRDSGQSSSLYNKRRHLLAKSANSSRHLSNLSEINEEEYYENERDGLSRRHHPDYYEKDDEEETDEDEQQEEDGDEDDEDDDDEEVASNMRDQDEDAGSFYDDEEEADDYCESGGIFHQQQPPRGAMISSISQQVNTSFKLNLPKKAIERLAAAKAAALKTAPIKSSKIIEKLQEQNGVVESEYFTEGNGEVDGGEEDKKSPTRIAKTKNSKSYSAVDNPQPPSQPQLPSKTRRIEQLELACESPESENLISSN